MKIGGFHVNGAPHVSSSVKQSLKTAFLEKTTLPVADLKRLDRLVQR
ncbi:hypothetical protein [Enterococcus casseliflavus]|nr:hypothetical protein [Enterococcus casseliflavus]OJG30308.1 hypothetical protein RU99_GL000666 [Enterococcus casseliflavus]